MFLTTSTFNPDFQLDFRLKDLKKKKTENLRCQLYFQKSEKPFNPACHFSDHVAVPTSKCPANDPPKGSYATPRSNEFT